MKHYNIEWVHFRISLSEVGIDPTPGGNRSHLSTIPPRSREINSHGFDGSEILKCTVCPEARKSMLFNRWGKALRRLLEGAAFKPPSGASKVMEMC
jgi:hypothetical protein